MPISTSTSSTIADIVTILGVPTMAMAFLYVGKRLQVLGDLEDAMKKVKVNLKVIGDYLTRHHTEFNTTELTSFSPLQLTDQGRKLIEELMFEAVFENNKKSFLGYIESEKPTLKYDVENAAIKSIQALADEPYMSFLKVFFYNHPERNMSNVAPTLGVYLRDKYLDQHPEIRE